MVSVGTDISLDTAAARLPETVLQGNLDPELLIQSDSEKIWSEADKVLQAGQAAPAHIFNLGHGVKPETDPGLLTELVARVHAWQPAGI